MPTNQEIEDYLLSTRGEIEEKLLKNKAEREERKKEQSKLATELRKRKLAITIPLEKYDADYQLLDDNIEDIEEKLATCVAWEDIAKSYVSSITGDCVRYVKFRNWMKCSRQYDRIKAALIFSAEFHVSKGFKLIQDAINDPALTMQQAALYRALLYNHNAVASVRDRSVWGKKADENQSSQTVVIASDTQMQNFIGELIERKKIEAESEEYEDAVEEEDEEFEGGLEDEEEKGFDLND